MSTTAEFAGMPSESEPLNQIIRAWLKRIPPRLQRLLDEQLSNLPPRYFHSLDIQGVEIDLALIERLHSEKIVVYATDAPGKAKLRVLMIRDEPRIFLRVVAALAMEGIAIERALIFTGKKDGMVIDHFTLGRGISTERLTRSLAHIRDSLQSGVYDIPELPHPDNVGLRTHIQNHDIQPQTILTVIGRDQYGFLFRVARVLADLELDLLYANIKTRAGLAVDTFHLLSKTGAQLNEQEHSLLQLAVFKAFS